jgi:paraquat-inducible protein B
MSRKANPRTIGLFIAVGLLLGIGGILIFSSSRFFTKTSEYVLYFDASLTGLEPGAPVKFRGVTVGSVKQVLIHLNQNPEDASLPVIIEINEDLLDKKTDPAHAGTGSKRIEADIKRGLRAKLESQSLLTGLLYVNMDFQPEAPATYHQVKPLYPEIPTTSNQIQMFMKDFAEISQKLNAVLGKLDSSLGELQVKELNRGLTNLLLSLNVLVSSPDLTNTLASAQQTLEEFRLLSKNLRERVDALTVGADRTLADSREALGELRHGVEDFRDAIAPRGTLRREVTTTLDELREAARSVTRLADFLNQHPNAVLSGRKAGDSQP